MALAMLQTAVSILFLAGVLFASAGEVRWPMGWAFVLAFIGFAVAAPLVLSPSLLVERSALLGKGERADALLSVAFAFLGCLLVAVRAVREERTLRAGLIGYSEYVSRVRWRLVPGVW